MYSFAFYLILMQKLICDITGIITQYYHMK